MPRKTKKILFYPQTSKRAEYRVTGEPFFRSLKLNPLSYINWNYYAKDTKVKFSRPKKGGKK